MAREIDRDISFKLKVVLVLRKQFEKEHKMFFLYENKIHRFLSLKRCWFLSHISNQFYQYSKY